MKLILICLLITLAYARISLHQKSKVPFTEGVEFCSSLSSNVDRFLAGRVYCMGAKAVQCFLNAAIEVPEEHDRCELYNTYCRSTNAHFDRNSDKAAFCVPEGGKQKLVRCNVEHNTVLVRDCPAECNDDRTEDYCDDRCSLAWSERETTPIVAGSDNLYHTCDPDAVTDIYECEGKYTRSVDKCMYGCYRFTTNVDSDCKSRCTSIIERNDAKETELRERLTEREGRLRSAGSESARSMYREEVRKIEFQLRQLPNNLAYCETRDGTPDREGNMRTYDYLITCGYSRLATGLAYAAADSTPCPNGCIYEKQRYFSTSNQRYAYLAPSIPKCKAS